MKTERPLISYHRGGNETHDEGTYEAYSAAIEQNAELVEFDVWQSSDGVLFCTHDEFDDTGVRLADLTWSEISDRYPHIPTYRDLLRLANGTSICHIDLKQTGSEDQIVDLAFTELDDPIKSAWFTSLEETSVKTIRNIDKNLTVALSLGRDMEGKSRFRTFQVRLGELFPFYRITRSDANAVAVNQRLLTRGLKLFCRLTDRKILVWTVNDEDRIRKYLADDSVDVLITDKPIRSSEIRRQLRQSQN